jgi:hypothetical protein
LPCPMKLSRLPSPTKRREPPHLLSSSYCTCQSHCSAKRSCPCRKQGYLFSERCHPHHWCTNV